MDLRAIAIMILLSALGRAVSAGELTDPVTSGHDLYTLLSQDLRPDDIAAALKTALARAGRDCPQLTDYQIYSRTPNMRSLKVKCDATPLYGVSLWDNGRLLAYGGDGMIRPFNVDDGEIVTFYGERVKLPDQQERRTFAPLAQKPAASVDKRPIPPWLYAVIAANVALFTLLVLILLLFWKAQGAKAARAQKALGGVDSAVKDLMLVESAEVLPSIFRHPSGLFIVRNRHGKRRLFGNLLFAILYRNTGMKLREIE